MRDSGMYSIGRCGVGRGIRRSLRGKFESYMSQQELGNTALVSLDRVKEGEPNLVETGDVGEVDVPDISAKAAADHWAAVSISGGMEDSWHGRTVYIENIYSDS